MASENDRLDVTHLTAAIDVLDRPGNHAREQVREATEYINQFKLTNAFKLHMFFLSYFEFGPTQS